MRRRLPGVFSAAGRIPASTVPEYDLPIKRTLQFLESSVYDSSTPSTAVSRLCNVRFTALQNSGAKISFVWQYRNFQ